MSDLTSDKFALEARKALNEIPHPHRIPPGERNVPGKRIGRTGPSNGPKEKPFKGRAGPSRVSQDHPLGRRASHNSVHKVEVMMIG